jgi:MFS family permease
VSAIRPSRGRPASGRSSSSRRNQSLILWFFLAVVGGLLVPFLPLVVHRNTTAKAESLITAIFGNGALLPVVATLALASVSILLGWLYNVVTDRPPKDSVRTPRLARWALFGLVVLVLAILLAMAASSMYQWSATHAGQDDQNTATASIIMFGAGFVLGVLSSVIAEV